jgi:RND family efflux transporter MFP subunit
MKKLDLMMVAPALLAITACTGNKETERHEKVIPVKVVTVTPTAVTDERNYVGTADASVTVSLGFAAMGSVEQVFVTEGQRVAKGQLLAALNMAAAQSSCNSAEASLRQAQDARDRLAKMHASGSLPDIKLVEVETGLQQAKSMAEVARKNLADCRLYAPCSGVVARRAVEPGGSVMPGVEAFKLVTFDRVDVKIAVPENEIGTTAVGETATMEVPALDNETFTGRVTTKGVSANPLSHTYEVRIRVDNAQMRLMPGMVCKVWLQAGNRTEGIAAPHHAVQVAHDGRRFVWLAGGGTATRRFVQTGALNSRGVEITSGLSGGELLVVEGFSKVSEGMKLSVQHVQNDLAQISDIKF